MPLLPITKKNTSSLPAAGDLRVPSTLTEAAPPLCHQSSDADESLISQTAPAQDQQRKTMFMALEKSEVDLHSNMQSLKMRQLKRKNELLLVQRTIGKSKQQLQKEIKRLKEQ